MPDWIVAVAGWRQERSVKEHVESAGLVCYQPLFRERRIVRNNRIWVVCCLFGRYFFVAKIGDWEQTYFTLMTSPTVSNVLMADERPFVVNEREIARFKSQEVDGFIPVDPNKRSGHGFTRGQRVMITAGNFKDHIGRYVEADLDQCADHVSVTMLGRSVTIELPFGYLLPVGRQRRSRSKSRRQSHRSAVAGGTAKVATPLPLVG
jgi:transcription antitermination factor NusG